MARRKIGGKLLEDLERKMFGPMGPRGLARASLRAGRRGR